MGTYQLKVKEIYIERSYTNDLLTLGLGLCEEAGEVAKAINQRNPKYKPAPGREQHSLEHELHDCLVYICGIANAAGIDLSI
jgi:NTP pyrophosphatase (non-canonical NTP hydrolase)